MTQEEAAKAFWGWVRNDFVAFMAELESEGVTISAPSAVSISRQDLLKPCEALRGLRATWREVQA